MASSNNKPCDCIVCDLITRPFKSRTERERIEAVKAGRPRPALPEQKLTVDRSREPVKAFPVERYAATTWLTGCAEKKKLFCWPCLIFSSERTSAWVLGGLANVDSFVYSTEKHAKIPSHMISVVKLVSFTKEKLAETADSGSDADRLTPRQKKVFRRLIDCVCFLSRQITRYRRQNSKQFLMGEAFQRLVSLLKKYDQVLNSHNSVSKTLEERPREVQNRIVSAVTEVLIETIKGEIAGTDFVSVLLFETADVVSKSRIVTVLRYLDDKGRLCDRAIGFLNIGEGKTAPTISRHIEDVVAAYGLKGKLCGINYDGATIMADQFHVLYNALEDAYPGAMFVHYCNPPLTTIIQQSTSYIKACCLFYQNLFCLRILAERNDRMTSPLADRLASAPSLFDTVCHLRKEDDVLSLYEFLEGIVAEARPWGDRDSVILAKGLRNYLFRPRTLFLFEVFAELQPHLAQLHLFLINRGQEMSTYTSTIAYTQASLQIYRETGFRQAFLSTLAVYEAVLRKDNGAKEELLEEEYRLVFDEILDNILSQLEVRFRTFKQLEFTSLLDPQQFPSFSSSFPIALLNQLTAFQPGFDQNQLRTELKVLYGSSEFRTDSVESLASFVRTDDIRAAFPHVNRLASLTLSLPWTYSGRDHDATYDKIETFCRAGNAKNDVTLGFAVMALEEELLNECRQSPDFYDRVLSKLDPRQLL